MPLKPGYLRQNPRFSRGVSRFTPIYELQSVDERDPFLCPLMRWIETSKLYLIVKPELIYFTRYVRW